MSDDIVEAVVVGSGFGGAVTACRLARRWPGRVVVVERGRRYPRGSFPRTPLELARERWRIRPSDHRRDRPAVLGDRGLFDLRALDRMDVISAAGLGGGSLVYANVFLAPPPHVFEDQRWPGSCTRSTLDPYYDVAKQVLGAVTVPTDDDERRVRRTAVFADAARHLGLTSHPAEVNVFFGPDPQRPLPPGTSATNRYGARQTSCTYCGECDIGCNEHAKNTLDLNYLHRAEHAHRAQILTDHLVEDIAPVAADGLADPEADGSAGYVVTVRDLGTGRPRPLRAKRVVLAAGTLGTVELLLRARDRTGTLRRLTSSLGRGFSGNGDFLQFVADVDRPTDPNRGPVITQYTDHGLFDDPVANGFLLEDAAYPTLVAELVDGVAPGVRRVQRAVDGVIALWDRTFPGQPHRTLGAGLHELAKQGLSPRSAVLLCMGLDASTGRLHLDGAGRVTGRWPRRDSQELYRRILAAGESFRAATGGSASFPMPSWYRPLRRTVTVHPLGGCALADDPARGVADARPERFGEVFGYRNLFVADGSLFPSAVGANPAATIAALAERVAEGITGIRPDPDL